MPPVPGAGQYGNQTPQGAPTSPYVDPYGQNDQNYGRRQQPPQKSNRGPILAGIGVVVVLALVGFLVTKLIGGGASSTISMPDVKGEVQQVAVNTLTTQGFAAVNITTQNKTSSTVAAGKVSLQNPTSGTKVTPKTQQVVLTISTGPNTVSVPDVTGLSTDAATSALAKQHLSVGTTTSDENTSETTAGQVVKTKPASGVDVAPNSSVTLYVSSNTVPVPNVIDQKSSDAKAALKSVGLKYRTKDDPTADASPGTVTRTSVDPESRVNRGSTVTLYVASAPTQSTPTATPTTPTPTATDTTTPTTTSTATVTSSTGDDNGDGN
jgi:beta-lactam-binding protein with PASTA domain